MSKGAQVTPQLILAPTYFIIAFSKATTIREGGFCHFHNVISDEKAKRNFWERVILELNVCKYHHWFYSNSIFVVAFYALITSPIILNGGYHMLAPLLLLFILCNSFQLFSTVTKKPLWSGDNIIFPCYASTPSLLCRLVPGGILQMSIEFFETISGNILAIDILETISWTWQ